MELCGWSPGDPGVRDPEPVPEESHPEGVRGGVWNQHRGHQAAAHEGTERTPELWEQ